MFQICTAPLCSNRQNWVAKIVFRFERPQLHLKPCKKVCSISLPESSLIKEPLHNGRFDAQCGALEERTESQFCKKRQTRHDRQPRWTLLLWSERLRWGRRAENQIAEPPFKSIGRNRMGWLLVEGVGSFEVLGHCTFRTWHFSLQVLVQLILQCHMGLVRRKRQAYVVRARRQTVTFSQKPS